MKKHFRDSLPTRSLSFSRYKQPKQPLLEKTPADPPPHRALRDAPPATLRNLSKLPVNLVLQIASYLPRSSVRSLSHTSRQYRTLLRPILRNSHVHLQYRHCCYSVPFTRPLASDVFFSTLRDSLEAEHPNVGTVRELDVTVHGRNLEKPQYCASPGGVLGSLRRKASTIGLLGRSPSTPTATSTDNSYICEKHAERYALQEELSGDEKRRLVGNVEELSMTFLLDSSASKVEQAARLLRFWKESLVWVFFYMQPRKVRFKIVEGGYEHITSFDSLSCGTGTWLEAFEHVMQRYFWLFDTGHENCEDSHARHSRRELIFRKAPSCSRRAVEAVKCVAPKRRYLPFAQAWEENTFRRRLPHEREDWLGYLHLEGIVFTSPDHFEDVLLCMNSNGTLIIRDCRAENFIFTDVFRRLVGAGFAVRECSLSGLVDNSLPALSGPILGEGVPREYTLAELKAWEGKLKEQSWGQGVLVGSEKR